MASRNLKKEPLGFTFGEDFLKDHAGHIITDPETAILELIANAYDAGAIEIDILWPLKEKPDFSVEDNGTGMTKAEFESRWTALCYRRIDEQGPFVVFPNDVVNKPQRLAFGRSGKGRHGAFCFADNYHIETWRDGFAHRYFVTQTGDKTRPFDCKPVSEQKKEGHGTKIWSKATRGLLAEERLRELIGRKFLVDPEFIITVNGRPVVLTELDSGGDTLNIPDLGSVKIHLVDTTTQDRTTNLKGIAWWVNKRMVGEPSWDGLETEGHYLDGRTAEAKRYYFVVEADVLEKSIKSDWSGFRLDNQNVNMVRDVVHRYVVEKLGGLLATTRRQRKRVALAEHRTILKELSEMSRFIVGEFIDQVQQNCPTLATRDLAHVTGILAKMEVSRNGYDLLRRLDQCSSDDLDAWNEIMTQWTANSAAIVLNELKKRFVLIERLQELVNSRMTDELHDLQPLFERGLWIFGPEYESIEFRSNKGMAEIVRTLLGGTQEIPSRKRPDFVVLPTGSIGIYSSNEYCDDGEISGVRKVLIVELKKGGSVLKQENMDQAKGYAKEIRKAGKVRGDTEVVGYVLASSVEPGIEVEKYGGFTTITPMSYDVILERAHSRTFNLHKRLVECGAIIASDTEVDYVVERGEQADLLPPGEPQIPEDVPKPVDSLDPP